RVEEPKRCIGAYLKAGEQSEKQHIAVTTTKAIQSAAPNVPSGDMFQATEGRWGSREIEITNVQLVGSDGQPSFVFHSGDAASIRFHARAVKTTADFVFGVSVFNADGVCC